MPLCTASKPVRWFRAVDIPSYKPKIYGYKPSAPSKEYEAFSISDSKRLEIAYQKGKISEIVEQDGLMTVHFSDLLCKPTFWDGPGFAVRRALWFEYLNNHKVRPLEPALDELIEMQYNQQPDKISVMWPPKDKKSKPTKLVGSVDMTSEHTTLILQEEGSWFPGFTKRKLIRGVPESAEILGQKPDIINSESMDPQNDNKAAAPSLPTPQFNVSVRPEYKKRKINHLVFCVHGIGQLLSVKFEQVNFIKDVDGFRTAVNKANDHLENSPIGGVQVLPVMWRNHIDDKINGLRPQQLFGSSNLAADVVLDFVMYTEPKHRAKIESSCVMQMNDMYHQMCRLHPEFAENPKVSIIGHSLGSVITYSLMQPTELSHLNHNHFLDFEVENLFTMGSPIGVLELIHHSQTISKGKARALYNIMRLSDPVATRLEPLVNRESLQYSPKELKSEVSNILQQFKDLTEEMTLQTEQIASKASTIFQTLTMKPTTSESEKMRKQTNRQRDNTIRLPEMEAFNRHARLDFSVQESIDLSLFVGLAGHLMYLDNPGVINFVLNELINGETDESASNTSSANSTNGTNGTTGATSTTSTTATSSKSTNSTI